MPDASPASVRAIGARLLDEVGLRATRLAETLERVVPQTEASALVESVSSWGGVVRGEAESASQAAPHPLDRLVGALGFSSVESDILFFAGLPEEHEGLAAAFRALHPRSEPRATVGLIAQVLGLGPAERLRLRATLVEGMLVRSGAVRLSGEGTFFEQSLDLCPALWNALHGLDAWPDGLTPADSDSSARANHGPHGPNELSDWLARSRDAARALSRSEPRTLFVWADDEETALNRAFALARHAGVAAVGFRWPASAPADLERQCSLHCLVRGKVPVVAVGAGDGGSRPDPPRFTHHAGPVVLCARHGVLFPSTARPVISVHAERLSPSMRQALWRSALPELAEHAPTLGARYSVDAAAIDAVVADVRSAAELGERAASFDDVVASVRVRSMATPMAGLRLIHPVARWEQLVLSPGRTAQLREATARLLQQPRVLDEWRFLHGRRGARGVRMLFAGPPGTGKTLSAEVLASELGVDLLVVDVSRVVSKWIGETEKNLAAVFDAAERAQAVLVFDEADALFGKRTEVSDAHDRYANLETAYLLSRVEAFEGLAILTTNLRQNIDPAFCRRLEFIVEFKEPDATERTTLWRRHIPDAAPVAPDLDISEIAKLYPVTGGVIRNAAVAAGFLAATEEAPIARRHVVRALWREYEKSGRAFPGMPGGMTTF